MQSIRITEKTLHENKEVEPLQPFQMNILQHNTYIKDLNWLRSAKDYGFKRDQQPWISLFAAYLTF